MYNEKDDYAYRFDAVLSRNTPGADPVEGWAASDLVELAQCIDAELQKRAFEYELSHNE